MKKLSLTIHVQERRKTGNIPPERLRFVMNHLISQHNLIDDDKEDGAYKFRKGGTQAVIVKKANTFRFITFFGPTGYVIDNDEIGEFNCVFQSAEYLKAKEERKARRKNKSRGNKKETNTGAPLKNLSHTNRAKLKRGTFSVIPLTAPQQDLLHSQFGHRPYQILISNFDSYSFIELLKYDGGHVKTLHKSFLTKIESNLKGLK